MSLIPHSDGDWGMRRHYGRIMDDAMRNLAAIERQMIPPYWVGHPLRNAQSLANALGDVVNDDDKFQVAVDVSHFRPDELKVTTTEHTLTIEGKHEEKSDEHGQIERHFIRKYKLPNDVQGEAMQSQLSEEGVLTVKAPKAAIQGVRHIPIMPGPSTGAKKTAK